MNIYVGNLSFKTTEEELRTAFEAFGDVSSVKIITDPQTGSSRGFAFVEMPNPSEAKEAIGALNGKEVSGRGLKVSEARERERSPGGGRSSGGRSGGGGGGGGYGGGGGRGRGGEGGGRRFR